MFFNDVDKKSDTYQETMLQFFLISLSLTSIDIETSITYSHDLLFYLLQAPKFFGNDIKTTWERHTG